MFYEELVTHDKKCCHWKNVTPKGYYDVNGGIFIFFNGTNNFFVQVATLHLSNYLICFNRVK